MARPVTARASGVGRRSLPRTFARWIIFIVVGGYLLLPLFAMLEFSTRETPTAMAWKRTALGWKGIADNPSVMSAIVLSLELAALTVAVMLFLLAPTMVWVHLRVPKVRRVIEFISLLPLTIPAIVIVVGLAPVYRQLIPVIGQSPLVLTFIYVVLVLPYAYRSIDASLRSIDIETLAQAARGLGASWLQVFLRVVVPSIRAGLLSAAVLSIALVLGEFTISSLLVYDTLQVIVNQVGQDNAQVAVAVSLAALLFGFVLLFIVSTVGAGRRRAARATAIEAGLEEGDLYE
jgi:putative spermidine/putrescine transport system permease protein